MPFQQNHAAETSWTGVPRLSCSPLWMDGQKPHVEIPISSDECACASCLPRAMVQAESKAAPSGLGCQLVPQHWNRGSACASERKATSLLATEWGTSSCALGQQQCPWKKTKLWYFVGNGRAPTSLQLPQFWVPIWTDRMQRAPSACLAFGLSAEVTASVPLGLQVG